MSIQISLEKEIKPKKKLSILAWVVIILVVVCFLGATYYGLNTLVAKVGKEPIKTTIEDACVAIVTDKSIEIVDTSRGKSYVHKIHYDTPEGYELFETVSESVFNSVEIGEKILVDRVLYDYGDGNKTYKFKIALE